MAKTAAAPRAKTSEVYLNVRFPQALVDRLDAYIARLRAEKPGLTVTRSDALRIAVEELTKSEELAVAAEKKAAGRR